MKHSKTHCEGSCFDFHFQPLYDENVTSLITELNVETLTPNYYVSNSKMFLSLIGLPSVSCKRLLEIKK